MRILLVALVISLSGCLGFLTGEVPPEPAPDFAITDVEGKSWNLTDLQGKVVLMDFMGTWCTPCQRAVPVIHDLRAAYPDLVVISVSGTDTEPKVRDFQTQHGADWPHAVDTGVVNDFLEAGGGGTMIWPSYAIIDETGDLRFYNKGETLPATFTAALDGITTREAPRLTGDALPVLAFAFVLGFLAWASPFLRDHTVQGEKRPSVSPLVGLAFYAFIGVIATWYSRPLSGRVATVAPFLAVAAGLGIVYWRARGTDKVQAHGKRLDGDSRRARMFAFWGNTLWYMMPVWGAVLHAAMLRTAPMETLLLPVMVGAGLASAESLSAHPTIRARMQGLGEKPLWLGASALILAGLWNGLLYLR